MQSGWPLGVLLASIVYLVTIQLGWRFLFVFGAAIWTGLIHTVSHDLVWGIIAVGLAFGVWAVWFGRDFDPSESLQ